MLISRSLITALALMLDALVGDPPNAWHPVAWMGSAIAAGKRRAPAEGNGAKLAYGACLDLGGATLVALCGLAISRLFGVLPRPLHWCGEALVLKLMLSLRGLGRAAQQVQTALVNQDLEDARRLVSWHLVSRDTSHLDASHVAAAAIESVAENTSDGTIAPLFFYAVAGLPGALAYRFLNTADSMLGYHDAVHEWLGKVPARLDDLLNLIPARLTAWLLTAAARLHGENAAQSYRIRRRDASTTESPNAGHPMSAMAGALGVELEKEGHYRLGQGLAAAQPTDIGRAVRLMRTGTCLAVSGFVLLGWLCRKRSRGAR